MSFELGEIKDAYKRLKTYIYYDNTDIILRRKLVEFETNLTKDFNSIFRASEKPYRTDDEFDIFKNDFGIPQSVESKLQIFTNELNSYNNSSEFFDFFLNKIDANFYPKKYDQIEKTDNFITNKRVEKEYPIKRLTAFIDAPIEIHLISILWTIKYGVHIDSKLSNNCIGNRLLLSKDKKNIVHGSGLFKPYFKQYQKWRDDSVNVAQELIKNERDVLFLNLDIKDYFHSVRVSNDLIYKESKTHYTNGHTNLNRLFLKIHHIYTEKLSTEYKQPYDFSKELKRNENNELLEFILPIGLLSSFVLANDYLKDFDKRIIEKYKPAYYGRYVDDILLVLADPNPNSHKEEENEDFKFSFKEYKAGIKKKYNEQENIHYKISFEEKDLNEIEKYVISNLSPLINLVDSPFSDDFSNSNGRMFKLNGKKSLFCQSEKTLLYYFDSEESDMVINKLKKELEERTSEFRDLPNHNNSLSEFESSAYHLEYNGTEGKIKTLQDYKENRYGLTLFLSNQIFSSLNHERNISEKEKNQVLKFFKGSTCLEFYRLWERIFTYFLVNKEPQSYIDFYIHCAEQIDNIGKKDIDFIENTKVQYLNVQESMAEYLDCAHELTISLNPMFLSQNRDIERHFEFKTNELSNSLLVYFMSNKEVTKSSSVWRNRFRETNMIRHQYVSTPLLNYTKNSKKGYSNLLNLKFDVESFELDDELIKNSPRPIKYWECCFASTFTELSKFNNSKTNKQDEYHYTDILGPKITNEKDDLEQTIKLKEEYYLDYAFEIYLKGNSNHLPHYVLEDKKLKSNFFNIVNRDKNLDNKNQIKEFRFDSKDKIKEPSISFANTEVIESNIVGGVRNEPNLSIERYQRLASILNQARKENSDMILFPEFFIPVNLLSSLVRYSQRNQTLIITGLEHIISNKTAFNFVATIIPIEVNGIKDATVVFRLKNHYAPVEEFLITQNHLTVPKPSISRYDIFNWKNFYFSVFYCFELADLEHRSLLRSKIDLLIALEWNKDTPYFSNIIEASSRDLHCYVAQVNTSQFGDTRLTQPTETARKDLLRLKGGMNDAILVSKLNIPQLREFQRKRFNASNKNFKPLPPNFSVEEVLKRIRNENIT
ncbi:hypothetical protein QO200_17225 [Flavobacterium sp. Arc3]|jgi:hypothetical protein|uniref:reverse transcriptase domain-containing protein n=1 Tax=Flavobacterium sp. Arc3 TaxID=3046686 RepID=UPI00352EDAEC